MQVLNSPFSHVFARGEKQHMSDIRQLTGCYNTRNQSGFDMEENVAVLLSGKALVYKKGKNKKTKVLAKPWPNFRVLRAFLSNEWGPKRGSHAQVCPIPSWSGFFHTYLPYWWLFWPFSSGQRWGAVAQSQSSSSGRVGQKNARQAGLRW